MRDNAHGTMDDDPALAPADDEGRARARDAAWVTAALDGDQRAFGRLYDAWYDRVFHVARGIVGDPEVAAEVAQDAFLSAWRNLSGLEDRLAFGGWLLRIARNGALNRATKERRSQATDDEGLAMIERQARGGGAPVGAPAGFGVEDRLGSLSDPSRVAEDGELVALVHEAAAALGPRDAEVLDLQLRCGLSPAEIGEVMGLNRNAANQLVHRVKGRFAKAVEARVLWRGSAPACPVLADLVRAAGVDRFGEEAVKIADRHAPGCAECGERRRLRLQPAALFASVPIAAAPVLLKQQSAHALAAAGVPMQGSSSLGVSVDAGVGVDADLGGDDLDPREPSEGGRPGTRPGRPLVMALVALAVFGLLVTLLAVGLDDGGLGDEEVATGTGTPSTASAPAASPVQPSVAPTTEPEVTGTTLAADAPPAGDAPPFGGSPAPGQPAPDPAVPDPTAPDPTASWPVSPPTVRLAITPATATTGYRMALAPVLSWEVTGGTSVRVERVLAIGALVLSTDAAGSTRVCPGTITTQQTCDASVGLHRFRVTAEGPDGARVEQTVELQLYPRPQ